MNDGNSPTNRWKSVVLALGLVAGLLAMVATGKQVIGSEVGGSCESALGCKFGNICIGKRCYASCSSDGDCPATWHCGTTAVMVTVERTLSKSESRRATEKICFAPKSGFVNK